MNCQDNNQRRLQGMSLVGCFCLLVLQALVVSPLHAAEEIVIDGRSEASVQTSIHDMVAVQPAMENEIRGAVSAIAHDSLLKVDYNDPDIHDADDVYRLAVDRFLKEVDGLTAEELLEKARKLK